jgi:transposase-like protein
LLGFKSGAPPDKLRETIEIKTKGAPMKKSIQQALERQQAFTISSLDIQKLMATRAKDAMAALGLELLEQEVERLAGKAFSRKGRELSYRGGSAPTSLMVDGAKIRFIRPRVRGQDGSEVPLPILEKLRDQDLFDEHIAARILSGVSTRNYESVVDAFSKKTGISKSSVSRAFIKASQKELDAINGADLSSHKFIAIFIDGTNFSDKLAVVAVGITTKCEKIPLGLREGTTENAEIIKDLLASIIERGFTLAGHRILAVLDGGKALKSALKALWGDSVVIQRCWIHKLRNLKEYIPKENHGQLHGRMKKIMGLNSFDSAKTELRRLKEWLETLSFDAAKSLEESGLDLLTVHQLGLTGELRKSLSSTNIIESLIGVSKKKTVRVTNWKYHPKLKKKIPRDKVLRWLASAITSHMPNMRSLRGFKNVSTLIENLNNIDQLKLSA